jgi:hypothetical protein
MGLPVRLPCPHHYRRPTFPRAFHRPALRGSCVTCFAVFSRAPRDAHDSTRSPHGLGVHDSGRATRGISIPALPAALLVSPLDCTGATSTASTSAVATDEGRTGGTFGQHLSDDHASEAGLLATDRQTHPIGHLDVHLVVGALLCPRRIHLSELAPRHGRRIYCLDHQKHLGSCPSPRWL